MPISARWRRLETLPDKRGRDPMPGVYELADEERRVIYIGQSLSDVPGRVRQHLQKEGCVASRARFWRYAYSRTPQASEAELIAAHLRRFGDLPPCNRATPRERSRLQRYLERSRG